MTPTVASRSMSAMHPTRLRRKVSQWMQSGFVRDVAGTFGTRISLIGIGVISSVLATRQLGPSGRGVFAVAAALSALCVQFGNVGLHASNTYVVVREPESLPTLVANSLVASFVAGLIICAVVSVVVMVWPAAIHLEFGIRMLVYISVPVGIAYLLLQNLLIGIGRIKVYNWIEIGVRIAGVILLATLIAVRYVTPMAVFALTVVTSVAGMGISLFSLPRFPRHRFRPSRTEFGRSFQFGIKAYLSALFSYMMLRADLLMVEHYLGDVSAGYYSLAAMYGDLVYMLPVVVGTLLFPRLVAEPTDAHRRRTTWRAVRLLGPLMVGAVILAGFAAPLIVRLLYGARFLPAVPSVVWLMPGLACLSVNTLFMNYFASLGMLPITMIAPGVAAALNIALNTRLIPQYGIVGASVASSIAYAVMLLCSIIYILWLHKTSGITWADETASPDVPSSGPYVSH